VFHMDVSKVVWNIAHVAMAIHVLQTSIPNVLSVFSDVSCKCVYMDIAYVAHTCCKCLHLYVTYACNDFQMFFRCFASVSDVYVVSFSSVSDVCCKCFIWMLQK
jgi:hypothetical protein